MRQIANDQVLSLDGLETLESRQMMAGNVTAFFNLAGDLVINGDNAGNRLLVEYTDSDVRIIGFISDGEETTINNDQSQAILTTPGAGIRDIKLNLRNGNDTIRFSRVAGRNLSANLGSGNDTISLDQQPFTGRLRINTNSGDDTVLLNSGVYRTTAENVRINTGSGDDIVESYNTHLGFRSRVITGAGNDIVNLGLVEAPHLDLSTGAGDDQLTLSGGVFRGLHVSMAGGDDTLNLPFGADFDPANYDQVANAFDIHLYEHQSFGNAHFDGGSGNNVLNGIGNNNQNFTQGSGTYQARVAQVRDFAWLDEVLFQEYSFQVKTFDNPE